MKCVCAQTRPQFILSSERVFGRMEFEPMLTPREDPCHMIAAVGVIIMMIIAMIILIIDPCESYHQSCKEDDCEEVL